MYQSRRDFALIYMSGQQNYAFAIGGIQEKEYEQYTLNSCEIFDAISNEWTEIAHLNEDRVSPGACSFQDKFVYVFGGYQLDLIEGKKNYLNSIEKYNIELNFWTLLEDI